jgi:cell shape-determining protein MreC
MKKYSSLVKGKSRQKDYLKRIALIILLPLFLWALWLLVPRLVTVVTSVVWTPIEVTRVWLAESQNSLPVFIRDRQSLLADINALQSIVAQTRGIEESISKLQVENEELRELLGAVPDARILARVVARPPELPYDAILLDRGSRDGMMVDTPVFIGRDQVIGIVARVYETQSLVQLVSSPGFVATAYVYGPNIYTTTEGMGGGVVRIRVPQGIPLEVDNIVILPALDSGVFGKISRVETAPTKPEKYGYILSDISLQRLQYVSVGRISLTAVSFAEAEARVREYATTLFQAPVPLESLITPETSLLEFSSTTLDTVATTTIEL